MGVKTAAILLSLVATLFVQDVVHADAAGTVMRNRLQDVRLSFKMKDASLSTFIEYCRRVSGLNFVIQRHEINKDSDVESIRIDLELKNVSMMDALSLALEPFDLAIMRHKNVLLVTTKKAARGKPVLQIYEVADIVTPIRDFPGPDINLYPSDYEPPEQEEPEQHVAVESTDELAELIRQFTGRETWEDDGITIITMRHRIFIRQYARVHREIGRFIQLVRGLR